MKAVQAGSQVFALPSSAFFSSMGVGGVGLVAGCCSGSVVCPGRGALLQAVRAKSPARVRTSFEDIREAFHGAGPG